MPLIGVDGLHPRNAGRMVHSRRAPQTSGEIRMNDRRTESKPGRPGMEPGDLFRLRWLSDAQVAPDGTRVAFVVTTLEEEKDRYRAAIWLVPCDGSAPARQFTAGEGRDTAPR